MSINFPGTIDVFVNPSGTSTLNDPDHSLQHSDANDAIEAIEAVIGTTAGTSILKDFSAGEFAVRHEGGTVSPGTLTFDSPVINDATLGTPTITGGTATGLTLAGTPVLDATSAIPFYNDSIHRQAIINGNFDVWQRGTNALTLIDQNTQFLADRWVDATVKDGGTLPSTITRTRGTFTAGELSNSFYYTRLTCNGTGSSLGNSSFHRLQQKIEYGTRLLCGNGKKVTVSFWARSDIANKRLGVTLYQRYGTGGTPSASEKILSTPITLTSTLTKYTVTFTTNTLSGKTFGTNNDDSLDVLFYDQWGTTVGNTDVQASVSAETYGNGYVDIAQVQLCAGDVALPFQPKSFEEELRACQRYYEKSYHYDTAPATTTTAGIEFKLVGNNTIPQYQIYGTTRYKVEKRVAGTVTTYPYTTPTNTGRASKGDLTDLAASSAAVGYSSTSGFSVACNALSQTTTNYVVGYHWACDAEL